LKLKETLLKIEMARLKGYLLEGILQNAKKPIKELKNQKKNTELFLRLPMMPYL